jgi:protein-S-isoprenylcysteine O-methyltransferase Ste14
MPRFLLPPVLVLLLLGVMWLLDRMLPAPALVKPLSTWVGVAGVLAGYAIAQWHVALFKRRGANVPTFGEPSELCEAGWFSWTRNPMYLGLLVLLLGAACWMGSLIALAGPAVFFAAAHWGYVPFEEARLQARHGARYADYCRRVPRWIGRRRA